MQGVVLLLHWESFPCKFRILSFQGTGWKCKLWYSDSCKGRGENASCDISATFRLLQRTGWKCKLWYFCYIQTLAKDGVKMQVVIFLRHSDSCKGRGENASCDVSATFRLLQRMGWKCKLWYFCDIQTLSRDGVKMQVVIFLLHSLLHGLGWKCKLWYFYYIQYLAKDRVKMQVVIFLLHSESCKGWGENASCDISATCRLLQRSGWKCQLWYFRPIEPSKGRSAPHPPPNSATERWPGDWFLELQSPNWKNARGVLLCGGHHQSARTAPLPPSPSGSIVWQ